MSDFELDLILSQISTLQDRADRIIDEMMEIVQRQKTLGEWQRNLAQGLIDVEKRLEALELGTIDA